MFFLIKQILKENPNFSAEKIVELLKDMGVSDCPCANSIRKRFPQLRVPPSCRQKQAWRTFLKNHANEIWAMDYFVTYDLKFKLLFVLVIINHSNRKIEHISVTKNPNVVWLKQQIKNAMPFDYKPKYLIHDNGGRPFLVIISTKDVSIFKLPKGFNEDENTSKNDYTELVKEYKGVKKVFIGKSVKPKDDTAYYAAWGKEFDGNTILIEIKDKRYCLVAEKIVEFSTTDSIEKFESPVGNSDVPYPLAYGSQNVYVFGLDVHKYIPKETVKGLSTGKIQEKYIGKCCPWKSELDKYKKKLKEKLIHKRPGWK